MNDYFDNKGLAMMGLGFVALFSAYNVWSLTKKIEEQNTQLLQLASQKNKT